MDLNVVVMSGRLGADPKMRYAPSGSAVVNFRLATKVAQDKTLWFDVTVWGKQAESVNQYLSKGSPVAVNGRFDEDEWEDQNGNMRKSLRIIANDVRFLGPKPDSSSSSGDGGPQQGSDETLDNLVKKSLDESTESASFDFPI